MTMTGHGGSNDVVPTLSMPPMTPPAIGLTIMPPRATGTTPAPAFTVQPSISPASGAVGTTFAVADGTITNGVVSSRQWLLNGVPINGATGSSYASAAAGTLTCQIIAMGIGGTTPATSAGVAVSATAFTPSLDHSDARNSQYL